jgi:hypothetical protein
MAREVLIGRNARDRGILTNGKALASGSRAAYNGTMKKPSLKLVLNAILLAAMLATAGSAQAQTHRRHERSSPENDRPAPAVPVDKRDSVVAAPGPYMGRPYWLALAQCGGIYFKLNVLYTEIAVRARAIKPDPTLNNDATKKLNDAIRATTIYYTAAERFLMNDRGIERLDAVLIYADQARAAGDRAAGDHVASERSKGAADDPAAVTAAIGSALNAAKSCPVLYQACQAAYPKACSDQLAPTS